MFTLGISPRDIRGHVQERFKAEALKLADKIGVAATARELKLHESQLYSWRTAAEKKSTTSERESELAAEVARLKRQLAVQRIEHGVVPSRLRKKGDRS